MADPAETTFKWKCPRCQLLMEEVNPSLLAVRKYRHEKTCKGLSGREEKKDAQGSEQAD